MLYKKGIKTLFYNFYVDIPYLCAVLQYAVRSDVITFVWAFSFPGGLYHFDKKSMTGIMIGVCIALACIITCIIILITKSKTRYAYFVYTTGQTFDLD